jgi:two-component system sensor histidine kinase RegB
VRPATVEPRHGVDFSWLVTLRWGAFLGQGVTILAVDRWMGIALPLRPLAWVLAFGAATNLVCAAWARRAAVPEWMLAAVMLLDVGLLTAVLYLTGGPFNPFSFLYLVNIALAAVTLAAAWTWALVTVSLLCFGGLFFAHVPLPLEHDHAHPISMHVQGMWVAYGVAAAFIVYFIQRVRRALAERDAELLAARNAAARHERLASLATLAAGAAHELATPLSTIAVIAKELERALGNDGAATAGADARLIREQVERCRAILGQMAADAGETAGEAAAPVRVSAIVETASRDLAGRERVRCELAADTASASIRVPARALAQALRGVLQNALEASPAGGEVLVRLSAAGTHWRMAVEDRGSGMPPDVLARAGEPFFTTKNGGGMGLGLFLARVVLERIGGALELDSTVGRGTTATLLLPAAEPGR